jgi:hypothetical protein
MKSITTMPADCCLIQAQLTRAGDRVRFRVPMIDYTIEEVDTDSIGNIRHRANNSTTTCSYHPGEFLWITRRHLKGE